MRKSLCLFVFVAVLGVTTFAHARRIAPPTIAQRVAVADLVVVGKVTRFGDKLIASEMFKGDTGQFQTATLDVSATPFGTAVKKILVGYTPAPAVGGGRPIRRYGSVQLERGQEVALILVKHPTKKGLYLVQHYYDVVPMKDNVAEAGEVKKFSKLLADPKAGLASKDAGDRFATAAMLVTRHRTPSPGGEKVSPLTTADSKPILSALAEADWAAMTTKFPRMSPQLVFARLGVTDKDGWKPPTDFTKFSETAQAWLKDNAGKYRIQAFARPGDKKEEPAD